MKKLLLLIMFLSTGMVSAVLAQNMRTLFLEAPDAVFPLLSKNCRADLVDFIEAGMKARVTNRLDGVSVLEELDDDYLRLAMTGSSSMQLKLLPFDGDTVICMVRSVKAEAVGSRVCFYDKEWSLLDGNGWFVLPLLKDFFVSAAAADEYGDMCDIYLVALTLSPVDNTLVAEYTMPSYMSVEDAEKVKPLLRSIVYRWDGGCFVTE